jgi:hypothetical protein
MAAADAGMKLISPDKKPLAAAAQNFAPEFD